MSWDTVATVRTNFVTRWLVATLALSIASALVGGHLAQWLALSPHHIFRGQIWRLVTWPLIEQGPLDVILTCAAIYKLGGDLSVRWGDRKLFRFVRDVTVLAGVATCLLSLLAPWNPVRVGGWALTEALVIAWAKQFPSETLVVYHFLRLRGRDLALFTLGVAVLMAIFHGPLIVAPELAACVIAYGYPRFR